MTARISLDVLDVITALRKAGKSWQQVADATGRTLESVLNLATTYKLYGIGPPGFWNEGRSARAVSMAKDGYSASQIGSDLGCSRNAVIGRLHRLRIGWTPLDVSKRPVSRKRRVGAPRGRREALHLMEARMEDAITDVRVEPDSGTWVFFRDLEPHHCRWPAAGEPGPMMRCCGAPKWGCTSYCEYHHEISTVGGHRR